MRMKLGMELLMDTTLNLKQTDPQHVLVTRADEELAHAYEQITRADEQIARADEQLSKLEHEAAGHPSDHRQTRMNKLRAAVPGNRPSLGGRAVRGFTGLMLAAGVCVAAIVWQSSYGDAVKQIVARWAPQFIATTSLPLENPGLPAQPSPLAVQAVAAETAAPQPAPLAQTVPEDVVPTVAALSPELTQLLESMALDLATLRLGIEQLKASQEQMARDNAKAAEQLKASHEQMASDNAKTAEQLKASQEQMARDIAKASEQNLRPKIAPPPRPTATPMPKRGPMLLSPQATARPQATTQLQPEGPQ
jgi:hypothetical protein